MESIEIAENPIATQSEVGGNELLMNNTAVFLKKKKNLF